MGWSDGAVLALGAAAHSPTGTPFPLINSELPQRAAYDGPEPTDADELRRILAPVLVLLAQRTRLPTWFTDSAQHVAPRRRRARPRDARRRALRPARRPGPVAEEVVSFFATVRQPA